MNEEFFTFVVTADSREEVLKTLDRLAEKHEETWRKVYRMRQQTTFRGYAGYNKQNYHIELDLRSRS